jgi:predicted 2-oxoglutarate/Fe(II)-dependent dioxygenase YbiX
MSSITTELVEILDTVQRPGDFYVTGTTEIFMPRLEVEGVGPVALPLLPIQVEPLVAVAERAPYGLGQETLVDTDVRRTWQISPERIRIEGRHWARTLKQIVQRAAEGLGVTGAVRAELYKLLVYDEGGFFVSHRDTEKAPGMFATLIIALPSSYAGGELLVRHRDREVRLELPCPEPSDVAFAAFYADCVHEVLPVTSGCRLTLVYNLLRKGKPPQPPSYDAELAEATAALRRWAANKQLPDDDSPEKLIYPLEHAYTPAELSFDALKGADAAAAGVLVPAARQADCDLHLALVTIRESGIAEHSYYGSRRRRYYDEDDDDFEIIEVDERSTTLTEWRHPDGARPTWGDLPCEEKELCPPDAFEGMEPDDLQFHEATGNEGASFDRTYSLAALVLWPRARVMAVLNQAGLAFTLPFLGELARRWSESGEGQESPFWRQAHELAKHMLRGWPRRMRYSWYTEPEGDAAKMLGLLIQLEDTVRIDDFMAELRTPGIYGKNDNEALVRATKRLAPERAAESIEAIIAGNAEAALSACGDLLARSVAAAHFAGHTERFIPAATVLLGALPGDPKQVPPAERWNRPQTVASGFVVNLLNALSAIDPALAERGVDQMLSLPEVYDPDKVLLPAVRKLTDQAASRDLKAVRRLRAVCLEHLRARIAEPLEPPRDWTRDGTLHCQCSDCKDLSHFLVDPERERWTFKAAQAKRNHVEDSIRRGGCDLKCGTDRSTRPYVLVCTKTQASYDRRAQQRKQDLNDVARLEG